MRQECGKRAFITGASSGIGEALAIELARRGYQIALTARRADRLREIAQHLRAVSSVEPLTFAADIRDAAAVGQAVEETIAAWGGIDLAVANAGIGYPTPASKFDLDEAKAIMDTNFNGTLHLFAPVIPHMIERGSGSFVGVASLSGLRGLPGSSLYSASKAAMQAFLEASRIELRHRGVAVTIVNPGFIKTPLTSKNRFPMPFLMTVERAAKIIANGIEARRRVVQFPLPMSLLVRLLRSLPDPLYDRLTLPYARRKVVRPAGGSE